MKIKKGFYRFHSFGSSRCRFECAMIFSREEYYTWSLDQKCWCRIEYIPLSELGVLEKISKLEILVVLGAEALKYERHNKIL